MPSGNQAFGSRVVVRVAPDLLTVEISQSGDEVVLKLIGELDLSTGERLKAALDELDKAPLLRLVIDLSRLSFLDLSGMALLVSLNKRCQENGAPTLEIRPGPPAVQRLFELAGADDRLPFSRRSGPIREPVSS